MNANQQQPVPIQYQSTTGTSYMSPQNPSTGTSGMSGDPTSGGGMSQQPYSTPSQPNYTNMGQQTYTTPHNPTTQVEEEARRRRIHHSLAIQAVEEAWDNHNTLHPRQAADMRRRSRCRIILEELEEWLLSARPHRVRVVMGAAVGAVTMIAVVE